MTDFAVTTGTFSDAKLIKSRSVMQLVVEIPIENADAALKALGGVPQPGKEVHVAVARLATMQEPKGKRGSLAQQAGITCGEPAFFKFLAENYQHIASGGPSCHEEAALMVRSICGVDSRAEFDTDHAAGQRWRDVKGRYDAWMRI